MMSIWNHLRRLSLRQLWSVIVLFGKRPLLIWPTINATRTVLSTSRTLYGKAHSGSGPANAFRHAYWNALLAQTTYKRTGDLEKSITWAKLVTDLHENLAVNDPLDREMDFHNNAIGRNYFFEFYDQKDEKIVQNLTEMARNATKIEKIDEIDSNQNNLVYLDDGS